MAHNVSRYPTVQFSMTIVFSSCINVRVFFWKTTRKKSPLKTFKTLMHNSLMVWDGTTVAAVLSAGVVVNFEKFFRSK